MPTKSRGSRSPERAIEALRSQLGTDRANQNDNPPVFFQDQSKPVQGHDNSYVNDSDRNQLPEDTPGQEHSNTGMIHSFARFKTSSSSRPHVSKNRATGTKKSKGPMGKNLPLPSGLASFEDQSISLHENIESPSNNV